MTRLMSRCVFLGLACTASACGPPPAGPSGETNLPLARTTAHFVLRYSAVSAPVVDAYGAALESAWARITTDLGQSGVGVIEGLLHPDVAAFTAATGYNASGSVEGRTRFHIVSLPLAPSLAVHEFAHTVTLHLNPAIANNPVWLWEAVAVYEAGEFVHPATLPALVSGQFPTLAQLNDRAGPLSIYSVGFTLMEFMLERWQWAGVRALLLSHGDLPATFGLTASAFEGEWRAFVEQRYLR
jgi:hypothetical protein